MLMRSLGFGKPLSLMALEMVLHRMRSLMLKQSKAATALTAALCAVAFDVIPSVADEQAARPPIEPTRSR